MTKAKFGDRIRARLTCKNDDGTIIETSIGGESYIFTIGEGKIISEVELAFLGMRIGESKTIKLPAYKAEGQYRNELDRKVVFFDIELLEIMKVSDFEEFFNKTEGMISYQEASLLYELARNTKDSCIVEVGSYRGRSTAALGLGSLNGYQVPVFAIEPHEEFIGIFGGIFGSQDRGAFYKAMLDTYCYLIVRLINLSSEKVAPSWDRKVGLLWIDGDHSYEGVKRDFDCWLPHLMTGALIAFDDSIFPELGPYRLINELLTSGKFKKVQVVEKITVIRFINSNNFIGLKNK